jgi:hypothetical protein
LPKWVVVRLECWAQAREAETRPTRRSVCFIYSYRITFLSAVNRPAVGLTGPVSLGRASRTPLPIAIT